MTLISLKARAGIAALTFAAAPPFLSARSVTTWERVMKRMTLGEFAFASALALAPSTGHALDFDFSFTSIFGPTPGTVTGEVDGLQDNTSRQPATEIIIDSAPPAFNLTAPLLFPGSPSTVNAFTVTSG